MARWTRKRAELIEAKQALASALTETMSLHLDLWGGSSIEGKLLGEKLEGEMTSGNRVAYRATVTLYSPLVGFTEIDLLDVQRARAIPEIPN
jgi:hypothetical protein